MSEYYTGAFNQEGLRKYINSVFSTMGVGLLVSAAMAYYCYLDIMSQGFFFKFNIS